MRLCDSNSHQIAPGGPPTRRDLVSDTKPPLGFDRETLRASAHSLLLPSSLSPAIP